MEVIWARNFLPGFQCLPPSPKSLDSPVSDVCFIVGKCRQFLRTSSLLVGARVFS